MNAPGSGTIATKSCPQLVAVVVIGCARREVVDREDEETDRLRRLRGLSEQARGW
jgi:hypothetical protein